MEWYDSGIGFAVPLANINRVLQRLEKGEELHPGLLGISMRAGDPYTMEPIIAVCHPKSPAAEAGLKSGDKIVEIEGVKVASQSELRHQLGPRYAGDKISLVVLRGKERIEASLDLAAKLIPYVHPFLGVLPMRNGEQMKPPSGQGSEKETPEGDAAAAQSGARRAWCRGSRCLSQQPRRGCGYSAGRPYYFAGGTANERSIQASTAGRGIGATEADHN